MKPQSVLSEFSGSRERFDGDAYTAETCERERGKRERTIGREWICWRSGGKGEQGDEAIEEIEKTTCSPSLTTCSAIHTFLPKLPLLLRNTPVQGADRKSKHKNAREANADKRREGYVLPRSLYLFTCLFTRIRPGALQSPMVFSENDNNSDEN